MTARGCRFWIGVAELDRIMKRLRADIERMERS